MREGYLLAPATRQARGGGGVASDVLFFLLSVSLMEV